MKTFQDGDPLFGVMVNAIANLWPNGTAVLSGCTPTGSGAARQVTVAAGTVTINGTVRSVSQQTKTLDAATFDRYDLISVNTSGTVVVTKGTEERRVPALPANSVPIAICLIETGQTVLPADRIYDTRMDVLRLSALNIDADKNWGGKSIENISSLSSSIYTSTNVKLLPIDSIFHPKTIRKTFTGSRSGKGTVDLGTFTIPAQYIDGSIIGASGNVAVVMSGDYNAYAYIQIYINDVQVKSFASSMNGAADFDGYVSCKGGDVVKVVLSGQPAGPQYNITSCSGNIVFFGEDVFPSVCVHPTW